TREGILKSRESWGGRLSSLFDRVRVEEGLWDQLEELLITADVGVSTADKLLSRVKERVKKERASEGPAVRQILKEEMIKILDGREGVTQQSATITHDPVPRVVLVVGVNGSGKTTSIAKLSNLYKTSGKKVLLAAADTFRAAAIDQLKLWGGRMDIDVIAHQSGADAGAVVFDAMQAARTRKSDILIIDTAGRLHTKFNLMEELKKVKRVITRVDESAPHEIILVLDATTGQNGLLQAKNFTDTVGLSGIFLAKLDGTARGGIVRAIHDELDIPIQYIGTGEKLEDIVPFDSRAFVDALFEK
ncbi:MAG: signal recognition particle-docking protein FtsY, partial [Dehalococcoidia bacterium]|nr:signal recognition particle-docking protein FtsY [Dehalococcoidia bacterium]